MKMSSMQYSILTEHINKIETAYGIKAMKQHRKVVKFANDQFISFMWSIYWMIKPDDRKIIGADLNDTHIETALKTALKNYK